MKIIFFVITIILSISNLNNCSEFTSCYTNLECLKTGCCRNHQCVETSKCSKINKISYGLISVAAFIIIVLNFLYFLWKIKKTRKVVLELKKLDDKLYDKRKSSNLDFIRKIKERQSLNM